MKKKWRVVALSTALTATAAFAASCGGGGNSGDGSGVGRHSYNIYTATSPSNWNILSQTDDNDRQISNYLNSAFFEFDFARDENGNILEDGSFEVVYSAATKLEDVTATYAGEYGIPEGTTGNRAWKITLRDDLKWNDGTEIHAADFVYSMQQTLDPLFMNRYASQYYGANMILHGAEDYAYSGRTTWVASDTPYTEYDPATLDDIIYFNISSPSENQENYDGAVSSFRTGWGVPDSYTAAQVAETMLGSGVTGVTAEQILALQGKTMTQIKADTTLKATWDAIIGWWQTEPNEELDFFITHYTFPEVDFDTEVGIFSTAENEIVVIFDNTMNLLDENGDLTYEAAYYMRDLPLVKEDLYESCKKEPVAGATLWTSNYNSSIATTASWGPYMLTEFQAGSTYTLSRNENWYGYGMDQYEGQYQTDRIVCRTIPEWNTAFQAFQLGQIDEVSIDPSVADTYRSSERAVFTPSDLVASVHVQSSREALENRESEGINKTILMYQKFRQALSLAINRTEYASYATTSSQAGLGYFNSMHYYDVANGGVYRETDVAREALLRAYGATKTEDGKGWIVGGVTYTDLEEAEEALTGYNLTLARQLVDQAYDEALKAGDIDADDVVELVFGTSEDTPSSRRHYDYLNGAWTELVKGTKLEGRFRTTFRGTYGNDWANAFLRGEYDIAPASGFSGGAWNPYYMIGAEVDVNESIRYNYGWDTRLESFEFTMPGDETHPAVTDTLSIQDWFDSLNGLGGTYDFSLYPTQDRLALVAELEYYALTSYWDIPTFYSYSASLVTYKVEYATYSYNTFMSYGGVQYMTYNYDDAEWDAYVASQGGKLNYAN